MGKLKESIDREFLNKLDNISFNIGGKMQSNYGGIRKSDKKGLSLEFSDFREYNAGDDIRRIDWKGFARNGRLNVKLFMEEKQADINIFIDNSKSMDMGGKLDFAKKFTASIAYIGISNMDNINIHLCGEEIKSNKLNIANKNRFMEIVDFLDNEEISENTRINNAIVSKKDLKMKKGKSLIISDFFSEDGYQEAIKSLQYKKQEVTLIQVLSREELEPDMEGSMCLIDSETEERQNIIIDKNIIEKYKKELKRYTNEIKEFCIKRGVQYYLFSADMYIIKAINEIA